jgi:NAD-dependent dihydropyrimidine dehydrogenase PreA subunit
MQGPWRKGFFGVFFKMAVKIDLSKCRGSGQCAMVCPVSLFEVKTGKSHFFTDREDECLKCHACEVNCPSKAITVD